MNNAKHPKFTKDLNNPTLHDADCPVSEVILETFAAAGFETAEPIYTVDGDRVRILAIDCKHQYPVVGEVIDFGAETTWLGRWTASGVYASSERQAVRKHSLKPNDEPGRLYRDPGLPEVDSSVVVDNVRYTGIAAGVMRGRSFVQMVKDEQQVKLRPQPQVDRAGGSGGRVRADGEQEYDAAFAEAVKRVEKQAQEHKENPPYIMKADPPPGWRVDLSPPRWASMQSWLDERWAPEKVNPNGAPAKLDPVNVRAGQPAISVSEQMIRNAKAIIKRWTQAHRADPYLHTETAKHVDVPELEKFFFQYCVNGTISHAAHLWSMAAVNAIAGQLRVFGSVEAVEANQLEEANHFCARHRDPRLLYVVHSPVREAA